ncbi:uncharacterized protein LOC143855407 [Tasmannia lanceolata]|uniref:uncharacterized protein LOC143855407 n=1 Tax=Tasmannia lanceolata TaxID=3420 RepID=UPI00406455B1
MNQVIQTPAHQQYLCKLLGYNYSIVYEARTDNKAVNALSRVQENEAPLVISPLSQLQLAASYPVFDIADQIQSENITDSELLEKHDQIQKGIARSEFCVRNGLIFHMQQLFIGSASPLRHRIMLEFHNT